MQKESNLIEQFKIPGISQSEILTYLQQGDSSAKNGVYYFLADQLKVEFNKKGKIKSIKGSADSFFIQRAIKDLTEISKETDQDFGRIVIEGHSPLLGFYNYKDLFQISPLKSVPNHISLGRSKFPYPFLVEYRYRTSKNLGIRSIRHQKMEEDVLLILNLLIYGGISDANKSFNNPMWVQVPKEWREPTEDEIKMHLDFYHPKSMGKTNMYLNPGFKLDDIDINEDHFASTDGFSPIELVDFKKYYQKMGIGIDDTINLPSIVDQYLDKYFNLDDKTKFDRALYWLFKHHETWEISKSISFNCLIQAIEVLMESQKNTEHCREKGCEKTKILNELCERCSSPVSVSGPTKVFRDFVEIYAGDIPKRLKDDLYSLRSSISHGSLILEMDSSNFSGFDSKSHNQRRLMDIGREIVVVCLLNWMMKE